MAHHVVWFDIPVLNLDRAIRFYSAVMKTEVKKEWPDHPVGVFSHGNNDVAGCLYESKEDKPSDQGPLLYFNVNGRLDEALTLVEKQGGKILKPKHAIGPFGWRAIVKDSEGNRIALHSET